MEKVGAISKHYCNAIQPGWSNDQLRGKNVDDVKIITVQDGKVTYQVRVESGYYIELNDRVSDFVFTYSSQKRWTHEKHWFSLNPGAVQLKFSDRTLALATASFESLYSFLTAGVPAPSNEKSMEPFRIGELRVEEILVKESKIFVQYSLFGKRDYEAKRETSRTEPLSDFLNLLVDKKGLDQIGLAFYEDASLYFFKHYYGLAYKGLTEEEVRRRLLENIHECEEIGMEWDEGTLYLCPYSFAHHPDNEHLLPIDSDSYDNLINSLKEGHHVFSFEGKDHNKAVHFMISEKTKIREWTKDAPGKALTELSWGELQTMTAPVLITHGTIEIREEQIHLKWEHNGTSYDKSLGKLSHWNEVMGELQKGISLENERFFIDKRLRFTLQSGSNQSHYTYALSTIHLSDMVTAQWNGEKLVLFIDGRVYQFSKSDYLGLKEKLDQEIYLTERYSISKETKIGGWGSVHEKTLVATSWEELQAMALPVRVVEPTIEIREKDSPEPRVYLTWKRGSTTYEEGLGKLSDWDDQIYGKLEKGYLLQNDKFFFDASLRVKCGKSNDIRIDNIKTSLGLTRYSPLPVKQVVLLGLNEQNRSARLGLLGGELTISTSLLKQQTNNINGLHYQLPPLEEFFLRSTNVRPLDLKDSFKGYHDPFDRLEKIFDLVPLDQSGVVIEKNGSYLFVPAIQKCELAEVTQKGEVHLRVTVGADDVRTLVLSYRDYCSLWTSGSGVANKTELFFPQGSLSAVDDVSKSWGSSTEQPRQLNRVVVKPDSQNENSMVIHLFSGELCWESLRLSDEQVCDFLTAGLPTFSTGDEGPTQRHYALSFKGEHSTDLVLQDANRKENGVPWPQNDKAKATQLLARYVLKPGSSSLNPLRINKVVGEGYDRCGCIEGDVSNKRIRLNGNWTRALQYAVVGEPFLVEKQWVLLTPQSVNAELQHIKSYLEPGQPKLCYYETQEGVDLERSGVVIEQLQGEELRLFKKAMREDKRFPVAYVHSQVIIRAKDLQNGTGQNRKYPHPVSRATFRLPIKNSLDGVTGHYEVPKRVSIFEAAEKLKQTTEESSWDSLDLLNWLNRPVEEDSLFFYKDQLVKQSTFLCLTEECPITITKSDGTLLVEPFQWKNQVERLKAVEAVREELTAYYRTENTVCKAWGLYDTIFLTIDNERVQLGRADASSFRIAMDAQRPYTVRTPSGRLVTVEHTALYDWKPGSAQASVDKAPVAPDSSAGSPLPKAEEKNHSPASNHNASNDPSEKKIAKKVSNEGKFEVKIDPLKVDSSAPVENHNARNIEKKSSTVEIETPVANKPQLKKEPSATVRKAFLDRSENQLNLAVSGGVVYSTPVDESFIEQIRNSAVDSIHEVEIDGVTFSFNKKILTEATPQPVVPKETGRRSIALWGSGAAISLLAGIGLYKWAQKSPTLGNWVGNYTPNWVKSRLG